MPNTEINWEELRKRWVLMGMPPLGGNSLRISVDDYTKCSGDIQTLTTTVTGGTAPYTYAWSPSTGLSSTTSANPTASHTSTVTYTVVVTDANGRTATDTSVVTVPSALSGSLTPTNITCNGSNNGSITTSISGGSSPYTYLWTAGQTSSSRTSLSTGVYGVTVSDACSNSIYLTASITQPSVLSVSITQDNNTCDPACGSATASGSGGTAPYTYLWYNGTTASRITGLTGGVYGVTVSDANSCTATSSVTITSQTFFNATGGTITYDGDYKIHTFTSTDTLVVTVGGTASVLVVGGGGGGNNAWGCGGGGGAVNYQASSTFTAGNHTATVGGGGGNGGNGAASSINSISANGGNTNTSANGGSSGNGNSGGTGFFNNGGGGGGAGGAGSNGGSGNGGNGGSGVANSISGLSVTYGGGGGGQGSSNGGSGNSVGGNGGSGSSSGGNGVANRGGGGGGAISPGAGGSGAAGVVIVRYKYQ